MARDSCHRQLFGALNHRGYALESGSLAANTKMPMLYSLLTDCGIRLSTASRHAKSGAQVDVNRHATSSRPTLASRSFNTAANEIADSGHLSPDPDMARVLVDDVA